MQTTGISCPSCDYDTRHGEAHCSGREGCADQTDHVSRLKGIAEGLDHEGMVEASEAVEQMTSQLEDGAAELLSLVLELRSGGYKNTALLADRLEAIAKRNREALGQ